MIFCAAAPDSFGFVEMTRAAMPAVIGAEKEVPDTEA